MVISYWDKILLLDGEAMDPGDSPVVLEPLKHDEYVKVDRESKVDKSSQKVVINASGKKITVFSSWFGEFILFYYMDHENLAISSSFGEILEFLRSKKVVVESDRVAIFESLVLDCPIRDRTFCKQIKKTTPGKKIGFDLEPLSAKSSPTYIRRYFNGDENWEHKQPLNRATEILDGLIASSDLQRLEGSQVLLPLSGGNDSRLLACLLKKSGIRFDCITFGPWESAEPLIAKLVAARLGVDIKHLALEDSYYKLYGDDVTVMSAGFSGHAHCHLYSILQSNRSFHEFIVHGYNAEIANATITDWPDGANISKNDALSRFVNENLKNKQAWGLISKNDKHGVVEDLDAVMEESCRVNHPQYFNDYLNKVDKTSILMSSIFNVCESFGTLVRPYSSYDYQSFFCALPTSLRKERQLFREACRRLFPQEFAIGTADEMFPYNLVLKNLEKGVFRAWHALSYGAFLASGGRLWIPNPKNFERHRKILFGVLKEVLMNAVEYLESRLNIDLKSYSRVSHQNRKQTATQYRIISSSALLRHYGL